MRETVQTLPRPGASRETETETERNTERERHRERKREREGEEKRKNQAKRRARCLQKQALGGNRDPKRCGKRETISNTVVTTRMTPALRPEAMRAVLMFH